MQCRVLLCMSACIHALVCNRALLPGIDLCHMNEHCSLTQAILTQMLRVAINIAAINIMGARQSLTQLASSQRSSLI